ncbi:mediator of RNA polymerase II transcription subunit 28 [Thamnophis elegans]|nr:mediator of RNA polymerase II transcription subunit 28 [Thamnophis elegans]
MEAQTKRLFRPRGPTRVFVSRYHDVPVFVSRFPFFLRLRNLSFNFPSFTMAAGLSGMFGNQAPVPPPPPPPVAPGGQGLAGLLPPNPTGPRNPIGTLVDDLEASFEACFASLVSQDYVNGTDQEEIRTGVDQCIQKFLDVARQTECFFLQKRLQLSVQKPDQVIKEDVSELRNELQRKETLIQKHLGKLRHWQPILDDINIQQKKPTEMPQGPLAYLEQASANIPAPLKQT